MLNLLKIVILVIVWILLTGILMSRDERVLKFHQLAIPVNESKSKSMPHSCARQIDQCVILVLGYVIDELPPDYRLGIIVEGAFTDENRNTTNFLNINLKLKTAIDEHISRGTSNTDNNLFTIPIIDHLNHIDTVARVKKSHTFHMDEKWFEELRKNGTVLQLQIASNLPVSFPIDLAFHTPIDKSLGVIYASIILLGLYIMIIWEIVDRTFAAIVASTLSIAILALMNERPTMPEILSWIDVETLLLLFGMMTIVAILSETGLFDYLAVFAFKVRDTFWARYDVSMIICSTFCR